MSEGTEAEQVESVVQRFKQLALLEEVWRAENPQEGGRHALNGFRFQLLCTLDRLVARAPGAEGRLAPESLGDILEADGSAVLATEVKATLSSGRLRHALDHLWEIHRLALERVPGLVPQLSYNIVYYRPGVSNPEAAVERWTIEDALAEDVASFKAKVAIERKRSVLNDLAARLVNDFRISDPFERIDGWLGQLVQAAATGDFEEACETIWLDAQGCWTRAREQPPGIYVWTYDDQPPAEVSRETTKAKQVLTGQRVDRRYLREGRFANRQRYDELHATAEKWLAALDLARRDRFNGFWIAGRSGSGKSIALLHLLAAMHSEDAGRIILWMDDQSHKIEDAVKWALPMMEAGIEVIVAADDPYQAGIGLSVSNLLNSSLRLLQNRAETVPDLRMPLFVFCGPPEQQELFASETSDDLDIVPYLLPPERGSDIEELKDWYFRRTGNTKLPTEGEGVLLVQVFFEWQMNQPIAAFAKRFRKRLKAMMAGQEGPGSIFDLIARILAMRRLYVNYPMAALDVNFAGNPALESAFLQLAREDHHFEIAALHGEIRFTHPHLADAIYRAWFGGRTDGPFRADHLATGIEAWWSTGVDPAQRVRPLWAIEGLLAATAREGWETLAPRWQLIADVAKATLENAYHRQVAEIDELPAYLPVWARLEARFALELKPSALEALAAVVQTHVHSDTLMVRGLPLACRTLIQLAPDSSSPLLASVRQLLNTRSDWAYWSPVAFKHGQRFGLEAIIVGTRAFVEQRHLEAYDLIRLVLSRRAVPPSDLERALVIGWLNLEIESPRENRFHPHLLGKYLEVCGLDSEFRPFVDRFLANCPNHSSWSYFWEELWSLDREARPVLAEAGFGWLRSYSDAKGWEFVLEQLIDNGPDHRIPSGRLIALGRRWLRYHVESDAWSRVWEMVWARVEEPSRPRMRTSASRWLQGVERKGWSYVWLKLWGETERDSRKLRRLGMKFLTGGPTLPGWTRVWEPLWVDPGPFARCLRRLGLEFLGASLTHPGWTHVWPPLWMDPGAIVKDLRRIGLEFLLADLTHSGWPRVWEQIWDDPEEDADDLRCLGMKFLKTGLTHRSWTWVWRPLWKESGGTPELSELALAWLEGEGVSTGWPMVWNRLWDSGFGDADRLRHDAEALLVRIPPKNSSPIGSRLTASRSKKSRSDDYSWSDTWESRWGLPLEADDRAALVYDALGWLHKRSLGIGGWSKIWRLLWSHETLSDADRASLATLAIDWLGATEVGHRWWRDIWFALWNYAEGRPEQDVVARHGRRYLAIGPIDQSYVAVWDQLFNSGQDRAALITLLEARRATWPSDVSFPPGLGDFS